MLGAMSTRVSTANPVLVPILPGGRLASEVAQKPQAFAAVPVAPLAAFDAPSLVARSKRRAAPAGSTGAAPLAAKAALAVDPSLGVTKAATAEAFNALARRDDVPGAPQVRAVKFLMTGVDGPNPKLHLMNTQKVDYHYDFAKKGLGMNVSLEDFNARTYFTDARKNIAGTILLHESYVDAKGKKGLYTVEFWPTDPVKAKHVAKAFEAVKKALPFASSRIAYHPAGNTQEQLFAKEKAALAKLKVKSIDSRTLFANVTYSPMNLGLGFGVLRVIDPASAGTHPPTARDVVVFKSLPNDLSHVGGIITEQPQTPLSHINLKAKQNKTPNAYLKDAANDPRIKPFIGKLVRYEITADGLQIREATEAEAKKHLDEVRPKKAQNPPRSLTEKHPRKLADLSFADAKTFGAKAANVAELRNILPASVVPDGYALPFSFYDRFMKATGLYDEAKAMLASTGFATDAAVREAALDKFRKKVKKATMPPALAAEIETVQKALLAEYGPEQPIRARSSTNNEDLPGFNGAGLYDSYTHRPDEGHLESTVKQVFASLWNFRAFEERDFHRVDHFKAAMGVLLHPNEDDEVANGVAYTKNIYDPSWPGFYVNAQVGESLVTNPDPGATPEEFLISRIGEHGEYETQYISRSTLAKAGEPVLEMPRIEELVKHMEKIQAHFKKLYGRTQDKSFAMDIEFKVRDDGTLQVKQARPTVD